MAAARVSEITVHRITATTPDTFEPDVIDASMHRAMVLAEGEQNRLIIENTRLVTSIAAHYRGQKGIPFEDFSTFAWQRVRGLLIATVPRPTCM